MTLRLEQVAARLPQLIDAYAATIPALGQRIDRASSALHSWGADPATADGKIRAAMARLPLPYALSFLEPPTAVYNAPPLGPHTVIAVDGSSIEPDRFAPVPCYVVNTGYAVLPYGLGGDADLHSIPDLGPHRPEAPPEDDGGERVPAGRGWGVNLQRDVSELEVAAGLAESRSEAGLSTLLLDGTLLPWDLDSRQVSEPIRRELAARAAAALDRLAALPASFSFGAYISASRAGELATSLAVLAEGDPAEALPSDSLVVGRLLGEGQRSAVFRSCSERTPSVEQRPEFAAHQVCFFYLRAGDDIARVEIPAWIAADAARVGALHATLVDQCDRCDGYPRALQEAHEQAVISTGDRVRFAGLLAEMASAAGIRAALAGKSRSKRRRAV